MIHGTAHFLNKRSALLYYWPYNPGAEFSDMQALIEQKLHDGEIAVGAPQVKKGEHLILIDSNTRYAIETPDA